MLGAATTALGAGDTPPVPGGAVPAASPGVPDDEALRRARRFLERHLLADGHNDLAIAIRNSEAAPGDVVAYDLRHPTSGQTDLPRLRAGGVGAQLWSVYIPAEGGADFARTQLEQVELMRRVIDRYPDDLQLALTAADVRNARRRGRIASLLAMEGGYGLENSLGALRAYQALGVRAMALTHNTHTDWADSALETPPRHGGLTAFGEAVVAEMNRLGMVVDLSHASDATARGALRVSQAPVIFSHGAARALCDIPRNTPDDLLRDLARNEGVFMVTFVAGFVDCEVARVTQPLIAQFSLRARKARSPAERRAMAKEFLASAKVPPTSIGVVANHIEHVRRVAGIDHVGIGGDFDGNSWWPVGLSDVSMYPNLFAELIRRGWSERDLERLAGGNLLRVLAGAEAAARRLADRPAGLERYVPPAPWGLQRAASRPRDTWPGSRISPGYPPLAPDRAMGETSKLAPDPAISPRR
ncbi:MAG: dipeptidase [Chromatiales bacterium]|nr:dipeptidase [Chromatiales bacterium]